MTEEIIIDGVNVAGCKYYKGKCMEYTHYCQIGCKECTDIGIKLCHYKQTERFKAKIDRLEQENKELKELNKKICEDWEKVIKVYWNVFEEIREIAKDICKNDVYENSDAKAEKILTRINEVLE